MVHVLDINIGADIIAESCKRRERLFILSLSHEMCRRKSKPLVNMEFIVVPSGHA